MRVNDDVTVLSLLVISIILTKVLLIFVLFHKIFGWIITSEQVTNWFCIFKCIDKVSRATLLFTINNAVTNTIFYASVTAAM
jgi:hypothetical protein